ncbi:alpha/beta hydrolase [Legionella sp. W05-934-2]|uniref:alpha/beta hydrolase n=1 Tax=Legionella sp. W05-934-2 TaxID=1198649 RepID=UPI003463336C
MKRAFANLFNTIHAWICLHVFNIPLPVPLPKNYKEKIKLAKAHLLKTRHNKMIMRTPRSHVIHVFQPDAPPRGKILITHGWMSQSMYMIGIIDALQRAGYKVYALDFPAHGESKGIRVKWFESVQAITEAQKKFGPFDMAIGHSYGGSMLLCAFCLAEHFGVQPFKKIALIAAPTTVTSPIKRAARRLKLNRYAYRIFRQWMRSEHNIDVKLLKPYDKAKTGDTKFLAIHGEKDAIIPTQESIHFCNNNPNAKLHLIAELNHNNVLFSDETYQTLLSFIGDDGP